MNSQLDPDTLGLGTAPGDLAQGQSDATLLKQVPAALLSGLSPSLSSAYLII